MFGLFKRKSRVRPDASCIVPRIKHTNFLAAVKELGAGPDDTPVTEPLVADLLVTYAFELTEAFQMFTHRDMSDLGLTLAPLRAAAVANLRKQMGELEVEHHRPVWFVNTGNDMEACLLLRDEVWGSLASNVPGEMVVSVPVRDALILTSADSPEGIRTTRQIIVECQRREQTHSLTKHLLTRRQGKWEVFTG
jgi:uncharacterized protein YtpQ (UPF0354 family)